MIWKRKLVRFLLGNHKRIEEEKAFWNMISSFLYSLQSAVLLLFATRIVGLREAGIFSIVYTIAFTLTNVGNYGMRNYQVSDINQRYSYSVYVISRVLTVIVMFLLGIGYCVVSGYTKEKIWLAVLLLFYRAVECMEDVYHAELEKQGRLDIAAKIMGIRIGISTMGFLVILIVVNHILIASIGMIVINLLIAVVLNYLVREFVSYESHVTRLEVYQLLKECFPLCVGGFSYSYLINAPKYSIDRIWLEEVQTIFSIIFMPAMLMNMVGLFIFRPMVSKMGELWCGQNDKEFTRIVLIIIGILVFVTMAIMIGGYWLGIPLLEMVYGVELEEYKIVFFMLLAFGGVNAISYFEGVVLTVIRKNFFVFIGYTMAVLFTLIGMDFFVRKWKLEGAAIGFGVSVGMTGLFFAFVICSEISRKKRTCKGYD